MSRTHAYALGFLFLVCVFGATLKLTLLGTTDSSDYREYVSLAQYIAGDDTVTIAPWRLLKPLNPLLIAALATTMDYQTAFIVQAVVLYCALVIVTFYFAREFFDDTFLSVLLASYVALSYPILKYGVDILTETGALFFYTLSLWYTLRYLKSPATRTLLINASIVTIGFLWKEYSIVSAIIFGLAILFHPTLNLKLKIRHILAYAGIFLAIHVPLQIYVYITHGYTYLAWYSVAVQGAVNQHEFTLRNIIKSTAALLSVLWLAVPLGLLSFSRLEAWQKRFWQVGILPPFIGYAWGYVSSRLLFVMAPPFLLVAGTGIRGWSRIAQVTLVFVAISANIAWLFLSYRVTL